jgi:hypothetical protein
LLVSVLLLVVVGGALVYLRNTNILNQLSSVVKSVANNAPGAVVSGGEGDGPGEFQLAQHVGVDGTGHFYITDQKTFRVQKFDKDGKYLHYWTVDQGKAELGPDGLAVDSAGNVYVAVDGVILKYDSSGNKVLAKFTGQAGATPYDGDQFKDFVVTSEGIIWAVSQRGFSDDLVRLGVDGKVTGRISKAISSQLDSINKNTVLAVFIKIAVSSNGEIYALYNDVRHPRVYRFSPDGKLIGQFGDGGDATGRFTNPHAIALDAKNRVYVGDQHNIQVFDRNGQFINNLFESRSLGALELIFDGKNTLYALRYNAVFKYDVSN